MGEGAEAGRRGPSSAGHWFPPRHSILILLSAPSLCFVQAVVSDPEARGQLPALLQAVTNGDGGIGSTNLGPILGAILGNPDASAALPSLLGLLGKLGLQLPGAAG